jgi:hypothetical protein
MNTTESMKRRQFMQGGALLALCGAVWLDFRRQRAATAAESATDPLLSSVCDLLIPATDTPGALAAGVPQFLTLALSHGLASASTLDRATLQSELDAIAGRPFLQLNSVEQNTALTALDNSQFAPPVGMRRTASVWPRIKKLIVMGYYSSEVGASQELQYALVPGRFDPDLPVKPGERAWSSDWVGQGF